MPGKNEYLIVSNHRSLADAPLLMTAISHPVRFVCHHYVSQGPPLLQTIGLLGTFPLEADQRKQSPFFWQSPWPVACRRADACTCWGDCGLLEALC